MSNGFTPTPAVFTPGWNPEVAKVGRERFAASGRVFSAGPQFAGDARPMPSAFSLMSFLVWAYNQGQVGSCFANMMAHILQLMMSVASANGSDRKAFNPSRRLIWHQCRKLDGSLGSWSDGGSIVHSFAACGPAPDGVGDCTEEDWPYKPDHRWLEASPTADVLSKANATHVHAVAELPFDVERWKRSIFNGSPVGIGIWWPYGWDSSCDQYGRTTGIGSGEYGHAISVVGWVDDWDGHRWWQILNSHGPIYGVPDPETQKRIVGFKATNGSKCYSFYAREDQLTKILGYNNTEHYNAAGVDGFVPKAVNVSAMSDLILL